MTCKCSFTVPSHCDWMKIALFWFKNKHGVQSWVFFANSVEKAIQTFYWWKILNSIYSLFTFFYSNALHRCTNETELHKWTNKLYSKQRIVRGRLFLANLMIYGLQLLFLSGCDVCLFTRNTHRSIMIFNLDIWQIWCRLWAGRFSIYFLNRDVSIYFYSHIQVICLFSSKQSA